MAAELNKDLAAKGLTATVTATATDSPKPASGGRRLHQGSYGGSYGGQVSCIVVYIVVIPVPAGQTLAAVEDVAQSTAESTAKDPAVMVGLLQVRGARRRSGPASSSAQAWPASRTRAAKRPEQQACLHARLAKLTLRPVVSTAHPQASVPASVLSLLGNLLALISQIIASTLSAIFSGLTPTPTPTPSPGLSPAPLPSPGLPDSIPGPPFAAPGTVDPSTDVPPPSGGAAAAHTPYECTGTAEHKQRAGTAEPCADTPRPPSPGTPAAQISLAATAAHLRSFPTRRLPASRPALQRKPTPHTLAIAPSSQGKRHRAQLQKSCACAQCHQWLLLGQQSALHPVRALFCIPSGGPVLIRAVIPQSRVRVQDIRCGRNRRPH
jgi:hypothetical protein